jgi:DNA-directed RNA polymerase specialized sigma subunit
VTAALEGKEVAEREEVGDRTIRIPEQMIERINRLVRQSRQMLPEIGREPTPEELAKERAMPLEEVCKLLIKKVSGAALWRDFEAKECACRNPDAQERDRYDN